MWKSLLDMDLGLKGLTDVTDPEVPPPRSFFSSREERQKIVKGIIISHVEERYQEHIIEIDNPSEMLNKLQKLKRDEVNDTSVSGKDQIRTS